MARSIHRLTDAKVRSERTSGRLADGGGLYLRVSPSGSKSFGFISTRHGRRQEIGLGPYPAVSLAAAREKAAKCRTAVASGTDPRRSLNGVRVPTFAEAAEGFMSAMDGQWSNPKHRFQWRQTLGPQYCNAILRLPVSDIGLQEVLGVLRSVWQEKPETASRLRGRIERVLNYAKVEGWRDGENPAAWRGNLENVLPKRQRLTRGHHRAMPHQDVPAFMVRLQEHAAMAARALETLILTAARTSEVLGATWDEFDFEARVWTVPAERMKARRQHRVPLTNALLEILLPLREADASEFVFPGLKLGRPLSNMAMSKLLERMEVSEATPHGFRSSFRDWCGDETAFPREVAEACLAHVHGDATERAYRRSDALEKRREVLAAWAEFCTWSNSVEKEPIAQE